MLAVLRSSAALPALVVVCAVALGALRVYASRTRRSPNWRVERTMTAPPESSQLPDRSMPTQGSTASAPPPEVRAARPDDTGEFGTSDFGPPLDFGPAPDEPST